MGEFHGWEFYGWELSWCPSPLIFLFTLIMRNCKFPEKTLFVFIVFFNVFQDLNRFKNVPINVILIVNATKDVQ